VPPTQGVVAKLTGGDTGMTVVQGTVYVGDLPAGASVTPPGTVTFRQDRTTAFDANALAWTLTPFQSPSASACTGLASNVGETSLFPANVAITTAVFAPATAASGNTPAVPEHCNLAGTIRAGRVGEQSSPGVTASSGRCDCPRPGMAAMCTKAAAVSTAACPRRLLGWRPDTRRLVTIRGTTTR